MSTSFPICDHADLKTIRLLGSPVPFAEPAIGLVKLTELELLRVSEYARWISDHKAPAEIQVFACRAISGTDAPVTIHDHSEHSHGHTIDIRPPWNPMNDSGIFHSDFDDHGGNKDGIAFVNCWKAAGWRWGATWDRSKGSTRRAFANEGHQIRSGRVDPMHFELELTPAQARRRGSLSRLRAYRVRHPIYMKKVLADEKVKTCAALRAKWFKGEA